jgi:hypothetical protein
MKTIIVVDESAQNFEDEINAILLAYKAEEIFDIKYSDNATQYSALIIIKK